MSWLVTLCNCLSVQTQLTEMNAVGSSRQTQFVCTGVQETEKVEADYSKGKYG